MMLSSFISERQIRHLSCSRGVSEETDGGGELDLGGKFLLLSHWLKKIRRPLIGQYQPIRNLQISTNQRSSCNQSETSMRLSTNKRAVGTFLLNLIPRPHQSLRRLRCSRTYVWSVFQIWNCLPACLLVCLLACLLTCLPACFLA